MGKDKLKRFAEMEGFSNVIQPEFEEIFKKEYRLKGNWHKEFKNDNPIVIELGCGKGDYTIGLARQNDSCNYIGIDIKGARIWRGAKTAMEEGLGHVRFLRTRIEFIESFFGPNEISEIWITFPDPQPGESREKHRLTHELYLDRYKKFLHPKGVIQLKTDSRELYDYTVEVTKKLGHNVLFSEHDVYANMKDDKVTTIQTFYEQKWLREGKKICYHKFQLI